MITIKINRKKYKGVYSWDDMTLEQFCSLASINMPATYESFVLVDADYDHNRKETVERFVEKALSLTEDQVNREFPEYYRKVIRTLTNIPGKVINNLPPEKINELYEYFFKPFVLSLLNHAPLIHFMGQVKQYEPAQVKHFHIGLRKYYPPRTVNIMGGDVPLKDEPIMTYTEASDIFRGMRMTRDVVKRLGLFMAIYCRRKDEKYNEKKALSRQDLFMKVPMSVIWSVFFYTLRRLHSYSECIRLFGSLPKTAGEIVQQVRVYKNLVAAG